MTEKSVDYYFTITSPWSYLGHEPFLKLAAETGYAVNFKPVDFGVIFPQSGGLPMPKRAYQRRRYRMFELQRWRDYRQADLNVRPKFFPADSTLGNLMVSEAAAAGMDAGKAATALMRACWFEEKNVADPADAVDALNRAGMDGAALLAATKTPGAPARAEALTREAVEAQVFGAPTYVVNGEPFWGQDRLELVARALKGEAGPYSVEGEV